MAGNWVPHRLSGFLLGTAATPLCLGSYVAELLLLPIVALSSRDCAEERYLAQHLPGYDAYLKEPRVS